MKTDYLKIILHLEGLCYLVITLTDEVINEAGSYLMAGRTIDGVKVIYEYLKAHSTSNNCLAAAHKFVTVCGNSPAVMRRVLKKLRSLR